MEQVNKIDKINEIDNNFPDDTLILYAYYENREKNKETVGNSREYKNLKFLLKYGNIKKENIVIVIHYDKKGNISNYSLPDFIPENIKVIKKENHGYDFEAWYHGLKEVSLDNYKHFVFINSSCVGPILPVWFENMNIHWIRCFTNFLNEKIKLVGCTKNYEISEHIQSYFWCCDRIVLDILINSNILEENNGYDFNGTILNKEIKMTQIIKQNNYEIKSISMNSLLNIEHGNINMNNRYYNTTINPLEIIFYKNNSIDTDITKLYLTALNYKYM